ncbi:MAG: hypothetical protein FJ150_04560 [Euryarchaeota archaeon]|nr:hypothetical protein [Euryarchaeota archaeon]
MIKRLGRYKISLESKESSLLEKLFIYYNQEDVYSNHVHSIYEVKEKLKDLKYLNYVNPYEAYLIARIKIVESLPPILEEHIVMLEDGEDLDIVIESLEYDVYKVKREVYTDLEEWDALLKHIPDDRLFEIELKPKGPGDMLIKELLWLKNFEKKIENRNKLFDKK